MMVGSVSIGKLGRHNSSDLLDKRCADILYDSSTAEDLPLNQDGEWHHEWLCSYGSVEDDRNYRRVTILDHMKLHAVLVHFWPVIDGFAHSLL
jgi:hypothetical protein